MAAHISRRIAITTGAAALCLGVAVPASAQMIGDEQRTSTHAAHHRTLTPAQRKALADKALGREAARLTALKAKVAGNDKLSAAQKTAFTAKIDKALAAVAASKKAVDDATTAGQVDKAVHQAFASSRPRFGSEWRHHLTFAEQQAAATAWLNRKADWLTALKTNVAGDDKLTGAQQAAFTAKIDKALAAISSAQDAVSAATTEQGLRTALAGAHVTPGAFPRAVDRHAKRHGADPGKSKDNGAAANSAKLVAARKSETVHRGCAHHHGAGAFGRNGGFDPGRHHGRHDGRHGGWGDGSGQREGHAGDGSSNSSGGSAQDFSGRSGGHHH